MALVEFFVPFIILDFDQTAFMHYGQIRMSLESMGTPIGPMDMLLAVQSRSWNIIRRKLERVKEAIGAEIFPVLVTHMISQRDVEEYVRRKGLPPYYSYDFIEMS